MDTVQFAISWGWQILLKLFVPALVWVVVIAGLIRIVRDKERADRPVVWDKVEDEITEESMHEAIPYTSACCRSGVTRMVVGEYVQKRS
jgi:hypothetical protein